MKQVQDGSLADHRIIVKVLLETLPQFERKFVKWLIARHHIVRAYDRGVTPDISRSKPSLFQNGDVPHAENLGQIISSGQTMTPAADNDNVILGFRLWFAPYRFPALVAAETLFENFECGISHNRAL